VSNDLFRLLPLASAISVAIGCGGKEEVPAPAEPSAETEPSTEAEPSSEPEGTDDDGDGFTVENGDCDDTDWMINPAMDEEPGDGADNDCDGRTDEKWEGVTVAHVNPDGASSIETIDVIGEIQSVVMLDSPCTPPASLDTPEGETLCSDGEDNDGDGPPDCYDIDCMDDPDCWTEPVPSFIDNAIGGGWIVSDNFTSLSHIDEAGSCTRLAEFGVDPAVPDEPPLNPYLLGVVTHPSGYYVAVRIDELVRIDPDGTVSQLASWSADPAPDEETGEINYDMTVWSVALDILTGEVGLVGRYGGFATWSEDDGLVIHKRADPEEWDGQVLNCGASKDGSGGWYAIVNDSNSDSPTFGEVSIRRFNWNTLNWEVRITWSDDLSGAQEYAAPFGITVNGDNGDYYVTASVASVYTVWRIREADDLITDLYTSDWNNAGHQYMGIISNY
jgi:hypothetical protein